MEFSHIPVMLGECIDGLDIKPCGIYVDCTLGGGGHSEAIASRLDGGRLIAIDKDSDAIIAASKRLAKYGESISYVHDDFKNFEVHLDELGIEKIALLQIRAIFILPKGWKALFAVNTHTRS